MYKYGKSENGTQRYLCHAPECPGKTFRFDYRYEGAKPGIDEKIIAMAANASGIRDTARVLKISADKVIDLSRNQPWMAGREFFSSVRDDGFR